MSDIRGWAEPAVMGYYQHVVDRQQLGAKVHWAQRQALITVCQRLKLELCRAEDAAQEGRELPEGLEAALGNVALLMESYASAVELSRG